MTHLFIELIHNLPENKQLIENLRFAITTRTNHKSLIASVDSDNSCITLIPDVEFCIKKDKLEFKKMKQLFSSSFSVFAEFLNSK